jgi:hypothetical protein
MAKIELTYTQVGDYLLPNLALSDPPEAEPLGVYGMRRKEFLKNQCPSAYKQMLYMEELYPHCREVEKTVVERMEHMMKTLEEKSRGKMPDKNSDPLGWAAAMSAMHAQAEELVVNELIYEPLA